jgi:hypothetical protein
MRAGLGLVPGIEDPCGVSTRIEKTIRYRGGPAVLARSALEVRLVSFPDNPAIVAVDRYGLEIGYSSQPIQRLIELSPDGLSPSAGVYGSRTEALFLGQLNSECESRRQTTIELQESSKQQLG